MGRYVLFDVEMRETYKYVTRCKFNTSTVVEHETHTHKATQTQTHTHTHTHRQTQTPNVRSFRKVLLKKKIVLKHLRNLKQKNQNTLIPSMWTRRKNWRTRKRRLKRTRERRSWRRRGRSWRRRESRRKRIRKRRLKRLRKRMHEQQRNERFVLRNRKDWIVNFPMQNMFFMQR